MDGYRVYRHIHSKNGEDPLEQLIGDFPTREKAQDEIQRYEQLFTNLSNINPRDEADKSRNLVNYRNIGISYKIEDL